MPPQRPPFATTDLRPSRSQIEALLSDVAREQGARQKLLDAFQAHGLLSGTEMLDESIVDSEGRYRKAHLMAALSNFKGSFRYRVIALLEKLGGVVWLVRDFGLFRRRVAIRNEALRPEIDACVRGADCAHGRAVPDHQNIRISSPAKPPTISINHSPA